MTEGENESRYARLNRLRMAIEERTFNAQQGSDESSGNKTERLRRLRLTKEAADRSAKDGRLSRG
jgi:hypothetical protein